MTIERWTDDRLDRLAAIVDSSARSIQANSESINVLAEASGRTLRALEELRERFEEDRVNFREYRERNEANVASLNAAVERLETIVAYLVRRDGANQ